MVLLCILKEWENFTPDHESGEVIYCLNSSVQQLLLQLAAHFASKKGDFEDGEADLSVARGDTERDSDQLLEIKPGSALPCSSSSRDGYHLLGQALNTGFSYSQPDAAAYN